MIALSDQQLVALWDQGAAAAPPDRALLLLAAIGGGDADPSALADLPLGDRDRRLIGALAGLFRRTADIAAACTACGEAYDCALDLAGFADAARAQPPAPLTLADGRVGALRLPTTRDVTWAAEQYAPEAALAARCLVPPDDARALAVDDIGAIGAALVAAEPLLDPVIDTMCPACGADQRLLFDAAAFLWGEITRHIQQLIGDVHLLAQSYGWSEEAVLALPPRRRQAYIAMVLG